MAKASKLQENHAIEEQKEMLRKKREENFAIASWNRNHYCKNHLKETETTRFNTVQIYCHVLGTDAAEVTADASTAIPTQLDEKLDSSPQP